MRNFNVLVLSAVIALAMGGCSAEGTQTGTTVGAAESGHTKTWENEFSRGKESLASGYYGLALERFKTALDGNPHSVRVLNALAVTYDRLGRHELAELYYDKALAIDPNSATTLNNVGYSMLTRERYEEALIYFEQALKKQQGPSDRRVTNANRHLAMDRLRVARQQENRQVVATASSVSANAPGRAECPNQRSAAVERMGERVFELITNGPGKAETSGHATAAVRPEPMSMPCENGRHSRVALINTGGQEAPSGIKFAGTDRNESRPVSARAAAGVEQAQAIPVAKPQPVRTAVREGQTVEVPGRAAGSEVSAMVDNKQSADAPTGNQAAGAEIPAVHAPTADPRPAAVVERATKGPVVDRPTVAAASTSAQQVAENANKDSASTASSNGTIARKPSDQPAANTGAPVAEVRSITMFVNPVAEVGEKTLSAVGVAAANGIVVETPPVVAAATPVSMPIEAPRIVVPDTRTNALIVEVSNGAGRSKLAARMRAYLEKKGLPVAFLTNAESFMNTTTTIFYKSGNRATAETFAKQLPIPVQFIEVSGYFADIRIRLGKDILEFDSNTLYAAKVGGSNV